MNITCATNDSGRSRCRATLWAIGAIVCGVAGCGSDTPATPVASERITPPPLVSEGAISRSVQATLVKQGRLPLVYMNETPASLRFVDLTADRDLGGASVGARQIVNFDARRGVVVAGVPTVPGALDENHRYGIVVEPDQESSVRQVTGQVPPPPRPRDAQPGVPPRNEQIQPPTTEPSLERPSSTRPSNQP